MKTLVISRPVYDYILPLVEFPCDGDNFFIDKSINTLSNVGSLVAITLARYNMDVSYTGMVGEDDVANKIKELLSENKVNIQYIETSYTEKTCSSHKIYNSKSNKFTSIDELSLKSNLTKYKYEFIPDVVIMDDKDHSANFAAINNYPNSNLIFISEKYTKESSIYLNKCRYIICNLKFASDATGVVNELDKSKNLILLFQKYTDIYKSNLIIRLNNFDILYCIDDEVRLIKNINKNIFNKENVYYSVLSYFLANNVDIENAIKLTNKAMLSSLNELDMINNIPDVKIIGECIEDYKRILSETVNNSQPISNQSNNVDSNQKVETEQINTNENNVQNVIDKTVQTNEKENEISISNNNINGVNDVERL